MSAEADVGEVPEVPTTEAVVEAAPQEVADGQNNENIEHEEQMQNNEEMINLENSEDSSQNEKMEEKNEFSDCKHMITLDLENQLEEEFKDLDLSKPILIPELKYIPEYYKFANPINLLELEWNVTLSRFDFPWQEISFEPFSAKECYKMYTALVTDINSFLKKVLGEKPKYQKMIQN